MLLDATNKKLQLVLDVEPSANEVRVVVSYSDYSAGVNPVPGAQVSTSNGTTPVDICSAPGASTQRRINSISVQNTDTNYEQGTLIFDANGTDYIMAGFHLAAGESFCWSDAHGFYYPADPPGRLLRTVVLANGGSYSSLQNASYLIAELQAGGGAGGSNSGSLGLGGQAGGGSAGGYALKAFKFSPGGITYSCSIGAGGVPGAAGGNNGGDGGNTVIVLGATTVTANGGKGGITMAQGTSPLMALGGASPAVSTNGDLNAGGMPGGNSHRFSGTLGVSGIGGSCLFGAGGLPIKDTTADGNPGKGYGSGGSGGNAINSSARGGAGMPGCIVIREYT